MLLMVVHVASEDDACIASLWRILCTRWSWHWQCSLSLIELRSRPPHVHIHVDGAKSIVFLHHILDVHDTG